MKGKGIEVWKGVQEGEGAMQSAVTFYWGHTGKPGIKLECEYPQAVKLPESKRDSLHIPDSVECNLALEIMWYFILWEIVIDVIPGIFFREKNL